MGRYAEIPLEKITAPAQTGRIEAEDDSIMELAESIAAVGLINPLTVKPAGDKYEIQAGHRRFLACQAIQFSPVPCIISETENDETYEVMIAENVARKDMTPVEEAALLKELQELKNYGTGTLAKYVGKSPAWVKQRLDILSLPADIQEFLHKHGMAIESAKVLAKVDDPELREKWGRQIVTDRVNTRTVILWVNGYLASQQYEEFEGDPRDLGTEDGAILTPKGTCWVCKGRHPYEHLKSIMICGECHRALLKAIITGGVDEQHHSRPVGTNHRANPKDREEGGTTGGEDGASVQTPPQEVPA